MSKQIEDIYPVSPLQEGILFHSVADPDAHEYVVQIGYLLHGPLEAGAYQEAWQRVINRHSVSRTSFLWQRDDKPLQVVRRKAHLNWQVHDWRHLSDSEQQDRRQALIEADRKRDFDLSKAPLLRLTLIRFEDDLHYCLFTHHHIVMDGWSLAIVFKEVFDFYNVLITGQEPRSEPVRPYGDFIEWLQKQNTSAAEAFWRKTLRGMANVTSLESVCPPPDPSLMSQVHSANRYGQRSLDLASTVSDALPSVLRRRKLTASTLFQGAWAILLSRYTGDRNVIFGTTSSGRPPELKGVESMVGPFISTLPVRTDVPPDEPVATWLGRLQDHQSTSRLYDHTPLTEIHAWSDLPPSQPLFESLFVFENYPVDDSLLNRSGKLRMEVVDVVERTNYPITLVANLGKRAFATIMFDVGRFDGSTIERMMQHYQVLLDAIVADPDRRLSELPLVTPTEHEQLIHGWNETTSDYPRDACVHELFEEQVKRTPDAVAVVFEGQELTYCELDRRANRLARHLVDVGVGPDVVVGVLVERSLEMVAGILGILKAGGAYLPLDPDYPKQRLALMVEDTRTPVLLTQSHLRDKLPDDQGEVICLDTDLPKTAQDSGEAPASGTTAESLAYVIYTSGSTGRPKGTTIPHRGVVRLVKNTNYVELGPHEVFLQFAPISFDASTFELWGSLLNGSKLVIFPPHTPSLEELGRFIEENGITTLWLTAALFHQMVEHQLERLQGVRQLLAGGDVLSVPHVKKVLATLGEERRLINGYGPTENTTFTCCHVMTSSDEPGRSVPIGRPISNTKVYILDSHQRPVPIGISGELYIGGDGLAREYLNLPELTAEKFVAHPFCDEPRRRLYRTGDIVRWIAEGAVEFLGRVDDQIKIRGFRVELGEIEAVLREHPLVEETVVLLREDTPGDKRLVAYVVLSGDSQIGTAELREFLTERLPSYMVPSASVLLDTLPLTPSGKVDRKALPEPESAPRDGYVAPRSELESQLAKIWKETLNVDHIGVHDSFFELGGHSLLAMKVVSRVTATLDVELPLADVFKHPTLGELAKLIEQRRSQSDPIGHATATIEQADPEVQLKELDQLSDAQASSLLDELLDNEG